jgi:DNA mismatch repair ATPase MutS
MSIHEPPPRNLGIITGQFLEKGIHKNQKTGQLFTEKDLVPGNIISVHNRQFVLIEMDEYTKNYFAGKSGRPYELATVLEKIREGMRQQYPLVRDIFRKFDADRDGVISFSEFKQALQKWGFLLCDQDVLILMRHFDTREDGQISYNEFCDALLDEDYTQNMMQMKEKLNEAPDDEYAERAMIKEQERIESDKVRKAMRDIGDVMYKHSYTFTKIFKEFAHLTHERTVTVQQVQAAMLQIGHAYDLDTVRRCVLFVMPDVDLDRIDYVEFLKAMTSTFHDVCRVR